MMYAYISYFIFSLGSILVVLAGLLFAIFGKRDGIRTSGTVAVLFGVAAVLVSFITFNMEKTKGSVSEEEARYYINLCEYQVHLECQLSIANGNEAAKKAYQTELDRIVRKIEHEQSCMTYQEWDAYYKLLEENAYGNRNEGTLPGRPDTESFQK